MLRTLLTLAGPLVIASYLQNAYRAQDEWFVAGLGGADQGALGAVAMLMFPVYASFFAAAAGAGPLVARAHGRGQPGEARAWVGASLAAAAGLSLLWALAGAAAPVLAGLGGVPASLMPLATPYLRWTLLTGAGMVVAPTLDAIFVALGDGRRPMLLQGLYVGLYALLGGAGAAWWGLPGLAVASNLAQAVAVAAGLALLRRRVGLGLCDLRQGWRTLAVLRLGAPMALADMAHGLAFPLLIRTSVGPLGDAAVGGLGLGAGVIELLGYPVYAALRAAVGSGVGQASGAGDRSAVRAWIRLATRTGLGVGAVGAALFLGAGRPLAEAFAASPEIAAVATSYALVLGLAQPLEALQVIWGGALAGTGATRTLLAIDLIGGAVRVSVAWYLAGPAGLGMVGVWWGFNAATIALVAMKGAALRGRGWVDAARRVGG
ncbi:MAG: MATE family efflux transporter [Deltaproteobacteria bacterium]|nr:MATE family efflux transporter [Deltaproteobacteria bacterium]